MLCGTYESILLDVPVYIPPRGCMPTDLGLPQSQLTMGGLAGGQEAPLFWKPGCHLAGTHSGRSEKAAVSVCGRQCAWGAAHAGGTPAGTGESIGTLANPQQMFLISP